MHYNLRVRLKFGASIRLGSINFSVSKMETRMTFYQQSQTTPHRGPYAFRRTLRIIAHT